jgi:hypothetical protein
MRLTDSLRGSRKLAPAIQLAPAGQALPFLHRTGLYGDYNANGFCGQRGAEQCASWGQKRLTGYNAPSPAGKRSISPGRA